MIEKLILSNYDNHLYKEDDNSRIEEKVNEIIEYLNNQEVGEDEIVDGIKISEVNFISHPEPYLDADTNKKVEQSEGMKLLTLAREVASDEGVPYHDVISTYESAIQQIVKEKDDVINVLADKVTFLRECKEQKQIKIDDDIIKWLIDIVDGKREYISSFSYDYAYRLLKQLGINNETK